MALPTDLGAVGTSEAFLGFANADFLAYEQKKWTSNAFTLERRRAKDRLLSLARAIQSDLDDELHGLEVGASDEAPTVANARKVQAQWVFWTRNATDRASLKTLLNRTDLQGGAGLFDIAIQHQHACLTLRLNSDGLAVAVELATKAKVDRDCASEKLRQAWASDKLLELCRALPGGSTIGLGDSARDALTLSSEDIKEWIEPLKRSDQPFVVQVLIPRGEEILTSQNVIGTVAAHVEVFLPVLNLLQWTRSTDHAQVKEAIHKEIEDRHKRTTTFSAGERVTILSGLFAGRSGYLAEVDTKGRAKVMVGPVSVSVDAKDLKAT